MTKTAKQLKILAIVSAFAVFFVAASVVYGGLSWTGFDPVIQLSDGTIVNVDIAVPPGQWCNIDGPIHVTVIVTEGATILEEHIGPCGVTTATTLIDGDGGEIEVKAVVKTSNGKDKFPVGIMISHKGQELVTCTGKANSEIKCDADLGQ